MSTKKNNFLKQAGILAIAGILCRIIGILYRSPLTSIIGDEGNGYYTSAYNIYTIILLLSSYSIPSAVSKIIAGKLARKEYRNAQRIFKCALGYVLVVGGAASLFTFFGAGLFLEGEARFVLKVFAPTIFISGFVGVLRGYFQAHGSMMQTSFSQIVEQILNAVVSIVAAHLLIGLVAEKDETTRAIYGAAGSALGTGSGVFIAFLFMLGVYFLNANFIKRRIRHDKTRREDTYPEIIKMLFTMVTPIIMSTFIYNFSTSFNQVVYTKVMIYAKNFTAAEAATQYGIFSGKAMVIINIPIAIASAMSSTMIPTISASSARGDRRETNTKVENAMFTTMLIAIPSAVGLGVLAKPIMQLLFPQKNSLDQAAFLLACIAITVVFYSLSTLSNGILQGIGKVNLPVRNAAIALAIQTGLLAALLAFTDLNLYALVICLIVYSGMMCVLNSISVRRAIGVRENFKKMFFMPLFAAAIMGVAARLVYEGVYMLYPSNTITLLLALVVAVAVYFVAVLKLRILTEEQLLDIPYGGKILRVARKLRIM